eukprot:TRINITY_DN235_c1_g1_i1.p1 TRINITY_DN235_c1_g1~~TRINITY_DN235_c1_g1_i1.p1  ORF type:complete len:813 (-),score=209.20 TRINITY_DN235_c1_g1_i1:175-2613(-)
MEICIDKDSLRIILGHLFTLKEDRVEGEGFYSQVVADIDPDDPSYPPHLAYRWSQHKLDLDLAESKDWKNVRSVNREWNKIADEVFDFRGHTTPVRLALNKGLKESLYFLLRGDDYFYPSYIILTCKLGGVFKLKDIFEEKPHMFEPFVKSLLFDEENTRPNKSKGYLTSAEIVLSSAEAIEIVFTDERITDQNLQAAVEGSCWTRSVEFFKRAMRDPRINTRRLGFHLNRSNWTEGMRIYIEEGGDQQALIDILTNPQENVSEEMLLFTIGLVSQQNKAVLVLLSAMTGDRRLTALCIKQAKLTQDQLFALIYHSCTMLNEDPEGNGLRELLKNSDKVPPTALDAVISCGSIPKLRILIEDGRVDMSEGIYIASVVGNLDMIRELIRSGSASSKATSTSLKKAFITNEPEENIEILLNVYDMDDTITQSIPAIFFSPLKYLKIFLMKLESKPIKEFEDWINFMLIMSPFRDDPAICEHMLQYKVEKGVLGLALVSAVSTGKMEYVKLLMENKAIDLSFRNHSCVRLAKEYGFDDIYQYLLEHGGQLDSFIHPLHYPRRRWLMQMDIQIEAERRAYLTDPVLNAALTQYLNDRTAALNAVGPRMLSRLIGSAIYSGSTQMLQNLLDDPNLDPSIDDHDALLLCAKIGKLDCLKLLLNDPRVDPGAKEGEALRLAVESGNHESVYYLLNTGRANLAQSNALVSACDLGYWDMVSTFLSRNEINLHHWGVPSFIVLVKSGNYRAKKIAESMFSQVKEGLLRYDTTFPPNITFADVCNKMAPKHAWYESKWILPLELAAIAGIVVAVSIFSSKRH